MARIVISVIRMATVVATKRSSVCYMARVIVTNCKMARVVVTVCKMDMVVVLEFV